MFEAFLLLSAFLNQSKYNGLILVYYISMLTVLPAKSDSDVMFRLQSYQGLIIDILLV